MTVIFDSFLPLSPFIFLFLLLSPLDFTLWSKESWRISKHSSTLWGCVVFWWSAEEGGEASAKKVQKIKKVSWSSVWVCMFTYDHTCLTALWMRVWKIQCTWQRYNILLFNNFLKIAGKKKYLAFLWYLLECLRTLLQSDFSLKTGAAELKFFFLLLGFTRMPVSRTAADNGIPHVARSFGLQLSLPQM